MNDSRCKILGMAAGALLVSSACGGAATSSGDDPDATSSASATGSSGSGGSFSGGSGGSANGDSTATSSGDSSSSGSGSDSDSSSGSGTNGSGTNGSGTNGSGTNGSGTSGGSTNVTPIPGGGSNAAPLGAGCGPETASTCHPEGGACAGTAFADHEVKSAGAVCFFGEGYEEPSATVEHVTEVLDGQEYVHLRVTFDPNFVDTAYGECSPQTGWPQQRGHRYSDLVKSDHVELLLFECGGDLSMHFKLDFISEDANAPCGYSSLGVSGGDGAMVVGDPSDVLAATSSLDRNMNGCGYCDDVNSPCTDMSYAPDPAFPEWDFRMVYEVWLDAAAFGPGGFCNVDIDYVHASPAKTAEETVIVKPKDCGSGGAGGTGGTGGTGTGGTGGDGTGGSGGTSTGGTSGTGGSGGTGGEGDCPPDYELILTSEGEYFCEGPPDNGICPEGYVVDLTSEGELCISEQPVR